MSDLVRMKEEYSRRKERLKHANPYGLNKAHLFQKQQRQRALLEMVLGLKLEETLKYARVLEVGCGIGSVMQELLSFGVRPRNMHGVDIQMERVAGAKERLPARATVLCADGQNLPYPKGAFQIVMQFTALSSVLDDTIRCNIALEMLRVLAPGGLILWYDFWTNPTNKQTHGIPPDEIRACFPACEMEFHKVTLAPPIARRIVPVSWGLAALLEKVTVFNSHYLVAIRPKK